MKEQEEERAKKEARDDRKKAKLAELDNKLRKEYEEKRAKRMAEEKQKEDRLKEKKIREETRLKQENAIRLKANQAELEAELKNISDINRAKKLQEEREETKKAVGKTALEK